jgi:hypothetical protein
MVNVNFTRQRHVRHVIHIHILLPNASLGVGSVMERQLGASVIDSD